MKTIKFGGKTYELVVIDRAYTCSGCAFEGQDCDEIHNSDACTEYYNLEAVWKEVGIEPGVE